MKVIIAGGGTAGHVNPGLAIAKYIKQMHKEAQIIFIGTERGLETKLVPMEGFELKTINVKGLKRKLSLDTVLTIKELLRGLRQAMKIIKEFQPDVVIGTGGYSSGPVLFIASMIRIPTLIHEQNAFPGLTNRILSRFVDAVAISFKESEKYFKFKNKLVYTGNPVRGEMVYADRQKARQKLNLRNDGQLVVIFGGSLGAAKINNAVVEMLKKYHKEINFNLFFATGNSQYEEVSGELANVRLKNSINVVPYIYNAAEIYSAADLIVCRAGAITCSELTVLGIPSIMIPSPNVVENHQEYNARLLEKRGASLLILEKELDAERLYNSIASLLKDKGKLLKMAENAKKMGVPDATERIYEVVRQVIK